ncbi:Fe-S cluster assembly protein SufD [candidate division KSB1 bacterium]|nr:Fe-S cluster assembly protein SufD [candidate division KSB1 bacterium]
MSTHIMDYYVEEQLNDLLGKRDEPEWMQQFRQRAYGEYVKQPWPSTTDEAWRRTNISHIDFPSYEPLNGRVEPEPLRTEEQSAAYSGEITFHGSRSATGYLTQSAERQKIIFSSLEDAVHNHSDLVQTYFMKNRLAPEQGKFQSLHAAFWTHGVFLYVPEFVEVDLPIRIIFEESGYRKASLPHVLIILERGSKVRLQHFIRSLDMDERLRNAVVSINVADGASLEYTEIQNLNSETYNFLNGNISIGRDASVHTLVAAFGSKLTKHVLTSDLIGTGAHAKLQGIYFADQYQHIDLETLQQHEAPHATSNLLYKGAVKDRAHAIYQGMIKVYPDAQLTDAYQMNKNLLLNDQAHADSIPSLEIEANDVKCSHGSTVGKVNDEELFYLMSRGLSATDAKQMIVTGFFEDILNDQPQDVRELLSASIEKELAEL